MRSLILLFMSVISVSALPNVWKISVPDGNGWRELADKKENNLGLPSGLYRAEGAFMGFAAASEDGMGTLNVRVFKKDTNRETIDISDKTWRGGASFKPALIVLNLSPDDYALVNFDGSCRHCVLIK